MYKYHTYSKSIQVEPDHHELLVLSRINRSKSALSILFFNLKTSYIW